MQFQPVGRCPIGQEVAGRGRLGLDRLIVQQALQQLKCGLAVPPALDHEVKDLTFVTHCSPQVDPLPADPADHLVQVPARRRRGPSPLQPPGDQGTELDGPAPDRLIADVDSPLHQQLLNVPKTEAEPKVQPHGLADHVSRKPVIGFTIIHARQQLTPILSETF